MIWRIRSFGTQSAAGSRFVEAMLTIVETCRRQNRAGFDCIVQGLEARITGQTTPSLLPGA